VEQIDTLGTRTCFEYDKLSRPVSEKVYLPDSSLYNMKNFCYDSDFTGKLDKISQTERKSSVTYDYDSNGFLLSETEVYYSNSAETDSMTVSFCSTYDDLGRLSSRIYPDTFVVEYTYNPQGDLLSLANNNVTLWECKQTSSLGNITQL